MPWKLTAGRGRFRRLALMLGALLALTAHADAQTVSVSASGTYSVEAIEVPLVTLLYQVSAHAPDHLVLVEPAVQDRSVTLSLRGVSRAEAVEAIVRAAGVDFIVWGDRVFAGDPDAAVPLEDLQERAQDLEAAPESVTFESGGSPQEPPAQGDGGAGHMAAEESGGGEDAPAADVEASYDELFPRLLPQPRQAQTEGKVTLPFPGPDGEFRTVTVDPNAPRTEFVSPFPGPDGKLKVVPIAPGTEELPPPGFEPR